jgi:V8-like Glu-specific endopeptidase
MGIRLFFLAFTVLVSNSLWASLDYTQAIYGKDDREFISKMSAPKFKTISSSVALIISKESIEKSWFGQQIQADSLKNVVGLCTDEKHANLPSLNNCTGFLIGEDLLLSAGHCFIDESDCKNKVIVFDVTKEKVNKQGYRVNKSSVFACREILMNSSSTQLDFSLIKLDRKTENRNILKLDHTELKSTESHYAYMVGHPLGLPLMKTSAELLTSSEFDIVYKTSLDSFIGNSGSPVIHAETQKVIGLLVNGNEDFEWDEEYKCQRYKKYETIGNEGVLSIQKIFPLVKSFL